MKSLMSSVVLTVASAAASLEISKGIINTFSFDIFRKCVDGDYLPTHAYCEYGPQLFINGLAAVLFFAITMYLMKLMGKNSNRTLLAVKTVLFFLLLTATWRLQVSLQDNFRIFEGPQTFTEYLYVLFVWFDTVLVGAILGFTAWMQTAVSAQAKDRKEPKITFVKK